MRESNFDTNYEAPVPPLRTTSTVSGRNEAWKKRFTRRLRINFDYYLFSSIFFILLAAAIFFDELTLYMAAVLFAPLQTPLLVFCFNTAWQPFDRWINILFAWLFNCMVLFLVGYLLGWVVQQIPFKDIFVWRFFTEFSWANFLLITIGTGLTFFIMQRNPNQNVLVANIAIVYSLNLPLMASGIALASNEFDLFIQTVLNFLILGLFSIFIGYVIIILSKLTPFRGRTMLLAGVFLGLSILGLYVKFLPARAWLSDQPATTLTVEIEMTNTPSQEPTLNATDVDRLPTLSSATALPSRLPVVVKSATVVISPTATPTRTLTPLPTPMWAQIQASEGNGANIRSQPNFGASIVRTVLNGTLVQILPDTVDTDGNTWVLIRLDDNTEGWIMRDLVLSATPAPGW